MERGERPSSLGVLLRSNQTITLSRLLIDVPMTRVRPLPLIMWPMRVFITSVGANSPLWRFLSFRDRFTKKECWSTIFATSIT